MWMFTKKKVYCLQVTGSVAEWSKALVLGTSHFDDVGSNPTASNFSLFMAVESKMNIF